MKTLSEAEKRETYNRRIIGEPEQVENGKKQETIESTLLRLSVYHERLEQPMTTGTYPSPIVFTHDQLEGHLLFFGLR